MPDVIYVSYFENDYNDRITQILGYQFQKLTIQELIDLLGIVSQAYGFAIEQHQVTLHMYAALAYLNKALTVSILVMDAVDVLDRFPMNDSIGLMRSIVESMSKRGAGK